MVILILLVIMFISYNGYIYFKYGFLPSISDSYYLLFKTNKEFIFNIFIWVISVCFILSSPNDMFIVGCFLLLGVSTAPLFKNNDIQKYIHSVGAIGGIFIALLSLALYNGLYLPISIVLLFTISATVFKMKNKTYWIEIVSFLTVIISLFFV